MKIPTAAVAAALRRRASMTTASIARVPLHGFLKVAVLCVVSIASGITASAADFDAPVALTKSGIVIGSATDRVNEFLGIPYAVPPVGNLRWTPPARYGFFPKFLWRATKFGSECTQPGGIGSEDCLFLNVYAPKHSERRLPVMVWIHGGAFRRGGSDPFATPRAAYRQRSHRRLHSTIV